jgi:ribulose-phosphate 3-epimerase
LAAWRKEFNYGWRLEVDGGVDLRTVRDCRAAGADTFVTGSSFFKATDRAAFIAEIQGLA